MGEQNSGERAGSAHEPEVARTNREQNTTSNARSRPPRRARQESSAGRVDPLTVCKEFTSTLSSVGIHAALGYLNSRTRFRFTGIYRPEPPLLRNLHLFDRENPTLNVCGGVSSLDDTYCAIACATNAAFSTTNAGRDPRLRSHAARDAVLSYAGAPVRHNGSVTATLCHFDVRPRLIPAGELQVLELIAPTLGEWLRVRASDS